MEKQELLKKIERVIEQQTLPKEVKEAIDKVYIDYNDAYRSLLSKIEQAIGTDEKQITELNHIASYMKKDYEEEKAVSNEIEQISYSIRVEKMLDQVINALKNILHNEPIEDNKQSLLPILDVEEKSSSEKQKEEIKKRAEVTLENKKCAKEIVESVLSEINSSKATLLKKLSNIEKTTSNKEWMQTSQAKFKAEIEAINQKAKTILIPQIEEILNAQDSIIGNQILDLYEEYQKEDKGLTQREKFASTLRAEVNPEEVIRKIEEERRTVEKQEELTEEEVLPGDVLE